MTGSKKYSVSLLLFSVICSCCFFPAIAVEKVNVPFNKKNFRKCWKVESESPDYSLKFLGDTLEIVAPKGLTLWYDRQLSAPVTIEYDACVMTGESTDRLSDLNAFWMASDPSTPGDFWKNSKNRGKFLNCYGMSLYYLGFGGNGNTTTRFRRYDGDRRGIDDPAFRPEILREYTDPAHLLKDGEWYHVKITSDGFRTEYFINGERLVDFRDPEPLTKGYFGFRTTLSRTRITNFSFTERKLAGEKIPLQWIGTPPASEIPVTFGVPFLKGEFRSVSDPIFLLCDEGHKIPSDIWPLAYWDDNSIKWLGVAATVPGKCDSVYLSRKSPASGSKSDLPSDKLSVTQRDDKFIVNTGKAMYFLSKTGECFIDSVIFNGEPAAVNGRFVASIASSPDHETVSSVDYSYFTSKIHDAEIERKGNYSACIRFRGNFEAETGKKLFPFEVRTYFGAGSQEMKIVYSFIYDADCSKDFVKSMGLRIDVPMSGELYNRHIAFSNTEGGVWSEPVQPLVGRRILKLDKDSASMSLQERQMKGETIPDYASFNEINRKLIDDWASWDSYRLSQLSPDAFSIRKKATRDNPWIGTFSGSRAEGYMFAGDTKGGIEIGMEDFWQNYPSSIEITGATTDMACVTLWIWSPESEVMDLRHYDVRPHGLNASYEDVQEGMSDPYGIAKTTAFLLNPVKGYSGKSDFALRASSFNSTRQLVAVPEYLHSRRAFGIWSLPDRSTPSREEVENRLDDYLRIYSEAVDDSKWYGFWNYGDFMHAYDPVRHEWLYDVGGYAWDNTELASPLWLWYSFIRKGDESSWRLAKAMTRHNGEVDVYHIGPNAGLGSRHNVSHWGCGAKESRISQVMWNRFLHYLTADERAGRLMKEVVDSDTLLYTLDPMRLAQPRENFPCTAPARLRIGPDWMAYAANWMTEWERTGNTRYRDKIAAGMKSLVELPNALFTGPLALGYDPSSGVITSECDSTLQTTNHLMTIMGGFEFMNELMPMIDVAGWKEAWLDHADRYKNMAWEIKHSKFRVSRLEAYAAFMKKNRKKAEDAWRSLFHRLEHTVAPPMKTRKLFPPEVMYIKNETLPISTNDAALWSLDAIYMQEVIPRD